MTLQMETIEQLVRGDLDCAKLKKAFESASRSSFEQGNFFDRLCVQILCLQQDRNNANKRVLELEMEIRGITVPMTPDVPGVETLPTTQGVV